MNPILYKEFENTWPIHPIPWQGNCIGVLSDCIECLVTEERNGIYEVEFKYPVSGRYYSEIKEKRIIQITHDDDGDLQYFILYAHAAPISGIVTFFAHHISYFLNKIIVYPFKATSVTAAFEKLTWQNQYGTYDIVNRFTYETDNTAAGSIDYNPATGGAPLSIRSALRGIVDAFGGEYEFDNFTVKNLTSRGTDTGVVLRYGKDVIDLEQKVDASGTYDYVVAYWAGDGKSSLVSGASATGRDTTEMAVVDMSKAFESRPTREQLDAKAQIYIDEVKPWIPKTNLKIDFIALWQTEEYKDIIPITKLKLCDIVTISYPELGVDTKAKITKVVWDALAERYKEMIIGDEQNSIAQTVAAQVQVENVYEFVNKYGDTMYGDLYIAKDAPLIAMKGEASARINAAAPSSNARLGRHFHEDSNGEIIFYNETTYTPDKLLYTSFITRRYDANGENPILHGFYQRILNDGSVVTAFANTNSRNAWRTGLAVDKWANNDYATTTATDFFTVESSVATVSVGRCRKYGKVVQIYISWTNQNDITVPSHGNIGNVVIGKLVSGFRPHTDSAGTSYGDNAGQQWYAIRTTGNIELSACEGTGTQRTIAAGTTFCCIATFIAP